MLQPTPWPLLELLNSRHGGGSVLAGREERVANPVLRAAYAVRHRAFHQDRYDNGVLGEPCVRCGTFTHAFCETCFLEPREPPFAVCTGCDEAHLVCHSCEAGGVQWVDGPAARDERGDPPEGVVEVSAFQNERGETIRISPPLLLPLSELDNVEIHIQRYRDEHGL